MENVTNYITLKQLIEQRLRLQYGLKLSDKALDAVMDEVFDWLNGTKAACIRPIEPAGKERRVSDE